MNEGIIRWENILTLLIGVVLVAFLFLVIKRRNRAKQKKMEFEAKLLEKDKLAENKGTNAPK